MLRARCRGRGAEGEVLRARCWLSEETSVDVMNVVKMYKKSLYFLREMKIDGNERVS